MLKITKSKLFIKNLLNLSVITVVLQAINA